MVSDYPAIIFDLGGVILDLEYSRTTKAFEQLGLNDFNSMYSQAKQTGLFDEFEIGKLSANSFINRLLDYLPKGTSANKVVAAWNAMIIDFPIQNLALLTELRKTKKIYLLSNTNEIHEQYFNLLLYRITSERNLTNYFDKVYLSSTIGKRKPATETFRFVCEDNQLDPKETLFIDDTEQHILGAQSAGLQTLHYTKGAKELYLIFS